MKKSSVTFFLDIFFTILGTGIYAFSLYYFVEPSKVAPGGITGIALMLNHIFQWPVGLLTVAFNLPLIAVGYRKIGKFFILKTTISLLSFTLIFDFLLPLFLTPYEGERLISCLFGGVLNGIGIGTVFSRSGSTGGTDIINKLLNRKYPQFPLGRLVLFSDFVIIGISVLVYGSIESALYAIVVIFASSQLIDVVVYGGDRGKIIYIFSDSYRDIADLVIQRIGRGVSIIRSEGGYSGKERKMLLCAVRKNEYHRLKRLVFSVDPRAFMVAADSSEVTGKGFKSSDND